MPKGRYAHLARIGLLLVALILLGLFACPPRAYAQALWSAAACCRFPSLPACWPSGVLCLGQMTPRASSRDQSGSKLPHSGEDGMELYLVQHGAAKSEAEDPSRGLTPEGRRDVERVAEFLAPLLLPRGIDRIEHSDKLRARQTAEILAARLQPAKGAQQVTGLAPNNDVAPLSVRLEQESKNMMLVGHLPHLSRLVSRLLGLDSDRSVVRFQMGGVVRLDRDETGQWTVRWVIPPEVLSSTSPGSILYSRLAG